MMMLQLLACLELAGADAALPAAVVPLRVRVPDQEAAVPRAPVPRPLVLATEHP